MSTWLSLLMMMMTWAIWMRMCMAVTAGQSMRVMTTVMAGRWARQASASLARIRCTSSRGRRRGRHCRHSCSSGHVSMNG